ncbi:MFS transporter [Demequina litorisediminis]|uniref:MFS transporter n=1 Tax=Demequina litorisediminis TaxID=1849022 RepID=UPI0024E0D904|nr:MFS transporter [Demequina litorisediminis]
MGRERPWKIRSEGITWDTSGQPGAAQDRAADALSDVIEDYRFGAWRSYRARRRDEPEQWRAADMSTDVVAWMTAAELTEAQGADDGALRPLRGPRPGPRTPPGRRPRGALLRLRLPRRRTMTSPTTVVRRRFVTLTALRWLPTGLVAPTFVLLLSARGLSLATIGLLTALYSATTVLSELPTGGLADVLGRRPVIVAAALVSAASAIMLAVSTTLPWLIAAAVVMGLARALDSGPLEAWYVDAVHAVEPGADLTPGLARAAMAESVALSAGALASGAVVAWAPMPTSDALVIALSLPFLLKAALTLVQLVFVARWVHDDVAATTASEAADATAGGRVARIVANATATSRDVPHAIGRGVRLAVARHTLRRLLLLTAAFGAALAGIELLAPSHAANLLGGTANAAGPYAVLVTAGFLGSAAGSALAPLAGRLARRSSRAAALAVAGAAVSLAVVAAPFAGIAAAAFIGFYVLLGVAFPLTQTLMHAEVTATERATMLSLNSMALQSTAIVITATLGALAVATSTALAFAVIAVVLGLGSLTLVRWPHDPAPASAGTTSATTAEASA